MCQSQQERGPCILVERLVVVSKMNFVNIFTGKLLSVREVGAARSSRDVAYWHETDMPGRPDDVCCREDSVAKVVLPKVSKILRAAGAVFV